MYHWLLFNVIHAASSDIMEPVRGWSGCKVTNLRLARYLAYNEVKPLPHPCKPLARYICNRYRYIYSHRYRSCPAVNKRFRLNYSSILTTLTTLVKDSNTESNYLQPMEGFWSSFSTTSLFIILLGHFATSQGQPHCFFIECHAHHESVTSQPFCQLLVTTVCVVTVLRVLQEYNTVLPSRVCQSPFSLPFRVSPASVNRDWLHAMPLLLRVTWVS